MRKSVIIILLALISVSFLQAQTFSFNNVLVEDNNFTSNTLKDYTGCNLEIKGSAQSERLSMYWSAPNKTTKNCIMILDNEDKNFLVENPLMKEIAISDINELLHYMRSSVENVYFCHIIETKPGPDNRYSYYFIIGIYAKNKYYLSIESETNKVKETKSMFRTKCLIPLRATQFGEMESFFKEILPKVTVPK